MNNSPIRMLNYGVLKVPKDDISLTFCGQDDNSCTRVIILYNNIEHTQRFGISGAFLLVLLWEKLQPYHSD